MHEAVKQVLRWFDYSHLKPDLQGVAGPLSDVANLMATRFGGPEVTAGLRKLLEAKDCFVRAAVAANEQ